MVPRIGAVATAEIIAASADCDPALSQTWVHWIEAMRLRLSRRELLSLAKLMASLKGSRVIS